jgi:hypothetical protein
MGADENRDDAEALSPDDAFVALGNEARIEILRTLGEADGPLSFSTLWDRVGMRDSGQFNYHLDKVVGHFVKQTDDGYELGPPGRRVVEAVLSGAITDAPELEATPVEASCPLCDGATVVAFSGYHIDHYCTECAGHAGSPDTPDGDANPADSTETEEYGYLGSFQFPPAGIRGRTAEELFQAASTWGVLELQAAASQVCPRCSAPLAESIRVCETHERDGYCGECDNRYAVQVDFECQNCIYDLSGPFALSLTANTDLQKFLLAHDINPVSPSSPATHYSALMDYDEDLRAMDPFEARFSFSVDGDSLTLTVDDDLTVIDATRR